METAKFLGEEIKRIRTEILNLTQKELAEKLEMSIVYMSYLEKGKKIPSLDLIEKLYKLAKIKKVPDEVKQLVSDAKKERKKEGFITTPTNVVYRLEEEGLYSYTKLKGLLRKNVDNLVIIYGILTLLVKEDKIGEAKTFLLQSLIKIKKPEERKWVEATYYELEGNFNVAIQLMQDAISEFEKRITNPTEEEKLVKARLMFEIACIHFRYGQHLFYEDKKDESIKNFQISLDYHNNIQKIEQDIYYQMDYAGIFFWLALLGINPKENWENYIRETRDVLISNYLLGMNSFNTKKWKTLYTKPFILSTISFLIRSYAQLAILRTTKKEQEQLIKEGEFILATYTPIDINQTHNDYYRYYFNQACFYSIKAEIYKEDVTITEESLDICYKVLEEALNGNHKNKIKLMPRELESSSGISFFREKRQDQLSDILKRSKE